MNKTQPRYDIGQIVKDRKTFYKCKIIGRFWDNEGGCADYAVKWLDFNRVGVLEEDDIEEAELNQSSGSDIQ